MCFWMFSEETVSPAIAHFVHPCSKPHIYWRAEIVKGLSRICILLRLLQREEVKQLFYLTQKQELDNKVRSDGSLSD